MPHHHSIKVTGTISEVFGHRFVVATAKGKFLADIGPEGRHEVTFQLNDSVTIEGEEKPTEIKVHRISVNGSPAIDTHHGPKHKDKHDHHEGFSAVDARRIAEKAGFKIIGELSPHKKHYEASAEHNGVRHDVHVHRDHIMVRHKVR